MTAVPDPRHLQAVTVALPAEPRVDLVALAADEGVLFAGDGALFDGEARAMAGRGLVAALPLPAGLGRPDDLVAAQAWLAAVGHEDRTGAGRAGVTALGALPFDRQAPGRLHVPELLVGRDGAGRQWATVVGPAGGPATERLGGLAGELARLRPASGELARGAALPRLTPLPPGDDYAAAVAAAVRRLAGGRLRKVVLARTVEARFADAAPIPRSVARRLADQEPSCTAFAFPDGAGGRFLGASPELLVERRGTTVTCAPLAGTLGLEGLADGDAGRLLASAKDREEHRLVVEAVAAALGPRCDALSVPERPSLVELRTIAHLATVVRGTLRPDPSGATASVLSLLADLHPTPAVGGVPRAEALACIEELEPVPRGLWAGPVGWVDAAGDGRWMIGIRSATLRGGVARLTAGAGIVAASDPAAELAETTVKLVPVLEALAPGAGRLLSGGGP